MVLFHRGYTLHVNMPQKFSNDKNFDNTYHDAPFNFRTLNSNFEILEFELSFRLVQ